jgi:polysaccharide biosynthesis/export protein
VSRFRLSRLMVRVLGLVVLVGPTGCVTPGPGAVDYSARAVMAGASHGPAPVAGRLADGPPVPTELNKINWPTYRIETPDLLLINALRLLPLPDYKIEPSDALVVVVANAPPAAPIRDAYPVDPDGTINLGPNYNNARIRVAGLTVMEARVAIAERLVELKLKDPDVRVTLSQAATLQEIKGEHIVGPDGTVRLGVYGSVQVSGMTLDEAKAAIEDHLSDYLSRPLISVSVIGYNSKVYYVVTDGGGSGEQVIRLPATGSETVLDAVSYISGLPPVASKERIWVSRPGGPGCAPQTLPVDWNAIVQAGESATNYQILPGDRVYVMAQPIITFDTTLARIFAPIERTLGIALLGRTTVAAFEGQGTFGNNNR